MRAAAVFALGTYIMNVPEDGQSDLSISIDHNVGMRLLTLLNDGSPIVRRVSLSGTNLVRIVYKVSSCPDSVSILEPVLGNYDIKMLQLTTNTLETPSDFILAAYHMHCIYLIICH